jgi:hypothetical protein
MVRRKFFFSNIHHWPLTPISIGNIFLPRLVYMCNMVIFYDKDNGLEAGNRISTLISSTLDLWSFYPTINREHFPSVGTLYVWCGVSRW